MTPLLVFLASFLYLALFRAYGFQLEDEGTVLLLLSRFARGELPYTDFHTGYGPAFFSLGRLLLAAAGESTVGVRVGLAAVNACSASVMYVIARRSTGSWLALAAPLLWLAYAPFYAGQFLSLAVAYPAWAAAALWLGTAYCVLRWHETDATTWLAVAGALCGIAIAIKLNAGALAMAASVWAIGPTCRITGALDRGIVWAANLAMVVGVGLILASAPQPLDVAVHGGPSLAIALVYSLALAGRWPGPRAVRPLAAFAALGIGFAVVAELWLVPLAMRLGTSMFLRDVLFIGSEAAALYSLPYPLAGKYGLAVAVLVVGSLLALRRLAPVLMERAWLMPFAVLALGASALLVVPRFEMPESFTSSVRFALEDASFLLFPLAHVIALVALARGRGDARLAVMTSFAVAMFAQVFPRTDYMHVAISMPLSLVLCVGIVGPYVGRGGGWVAVGLIAASLLQMGPAVAAVWQARASDGASGPHVFARVEPGAEDELIAMGKAAELLRAHIAPGEPVLGFPAMAGVLFAAGARSPVPHDYWYPGRPSHEEERAMVAALAASPPRFLVTLNHGWTFFDESAAYFEELGSFVRKGYRLVGRFGRYDVLAHRSVSATMGVAYWQPRGELAAAIDERLAHRVQGVTRWLAGADPEEVRGTRLPTRRKDAILLMRAIRDGGDMRAAPVIVEGLESADSRIRSAALEAVGNVTVWLDACYARWSGDCDPADFAPYTQGLSRHASAWPLRETEGMRRFVAALESLDDLERKTGEGNG